MALGHWVCGPIGAVTKTRTGRGLDWSWTGIKTIVELLSFLCLNFSICFGCVFILDSMSGRVLVMNIIILYRNMKST